MAKLKNKKTVGKLYAHLVVDESGSMMSDREKTVEALNEYLSGVDQENTTVTITYFEGGDVRHVCKCVTPKEAKKFVDLYQPNGMTNLYDAIGESIGFIEKEVKLDKDESVAFVVMTDGHENASREFDSVKIKKLIKKKENEDWLMIYLGADQDGFTAGQTVGFTGNFSATFSKGNIGGTFRDLANRTTMYASSAATMGAAAAKLDTAYTDVDRKKLVDDEDTKSASA